MQEVFKLLGANNSLHGMSPQLSKLVTIDALISVSTTECECAFSSINQIDQIEKLLDYALGWDE